MIITEITKSGAIVQQDTGNHRHRFLTGNRPLQFDDWGQFLDFLENRNRNTPWLDNETKDGVILDLRA